MRPVFQRRVVLGSGDCMAACLASLLELTLDDIPDMFVRGREYMGHEVARFLATRGLYPVRVLHPWSGCSEGLSFDPHLIPGAQFIASVPSQRFHGSYHAVVGELYRPETGGVAWRVVHDPNAGNAPYPATVDPVAFTFLVPFKPHAVSL